MREGTIPGGYVHSPGETLQDPGLQTFIMSKSSIAAFILILGRGNHD